MEGWKRFAIANLPSFCVFFHSWYHSFVVVVLDLRFALDLDVPNGIWQLSDVASLARASALSFPGMSQ